jgi:hypothetical protein
MPPAILAADAEGGKARRGSRSEPPGCDACLAERRWPHDRRNFQGAAGADSAWARLGDADSNVRRTARPLGGNRRTPKRERRTAAPALQDGGINDQRTRRDSVAEEISQADPFWSRGRGADRRDAGEAPPVTIRSANDSKRARRLRDAERDAMPGCAGSGSPFVLAPATLSPQRQRHNDREGMPWPTLR